MQYIAIYNRITVVLGVIPLAVELAKGCRVRFAQMDIQGVGRSGFHDSIWCQNVRVRGLAHLGPGDSTTPFESVVEIVCPAPSNCYCVSRVVINIGTEQFVVHCEYDNQPGGQRLYYPSSLCWRDRDNRWKVMDTGTGKVTILPLSVYQIGQFTPQIQCLGSCQRVSPIHFFDRTKILGRERWKCQCQS